MDKDYWMLLYNNPLIEIGFLLETYTAIWYFFSFNEILFFRESQSWQRLQNDKFKDFFSETLNI